MSFVIRGVYRFHEFELNPARRTFTRNGIPVPVSPKAFEVLNYLLANPGRVVTKDELLKAVWPESFVEEGNLAQHIFALRRALEDQAGCIVTVPGRGYQFTAEVQAAIQTETALLPEQPGLAEGYVVQHIRERTRVVLEELPPALESSTPSRRVWRWIWMAAFAGVILLAVFIVVWQNRSSTLRISKYEQITHDGRPKSLGGTDGARVYFTEELPHTIAEVSTSGGAVDPIPAPVKEPWAGDVSPDGSTLMVISESGGMGPADSLWSFRLVGGSLRRVADGAIDSTFSPDGSRMAYATASGDIFVIRSDGSEGRKLASPGGYIRSLAWSRDGSKLRYSRDGVLWQLKPDGSDIREVFPGWSNSSSQFFGQWAPDGWYYFLSDGQLWGLDERHRVARIRQAKPVQLTFGPTSWGKPVLSRDGRTIFASGVTKRGQLVRFDAQSKQFRPFLGGISAEFVTFSSDGKSVAYVTYPEGILWKANADGTNAIELTTPPVYPKSVRWSPDGTQILFVDRTPSGTNGIYILSADGGRPRPMLADDPQNETDPSWSPDGKRIVYSTCPTLGASSKSDLRILDLATGKSALIQGSDRLVTPHWSPDGKIISAMTLDSMTMKLFSVESGTWSNLDTGPVAFPEWSHDSRFIYYLRWKGDAALVRMHPGDAKPETIVDVRNEHYTGFFTSWMNLDPSDAPMLLRDTGSEDIYALKLAAR